MKAGQISVNLRENRS